MSTADSDRQASIARELGASYRRIQQEYAWRDLTEFLTKIIEESNKQVDIVAIEHLSVSVVAHARGLRDAVEKIRKHVDYAMNGGSV